MESRAVFVRHERFNLYTMDLLSKKCVPCEGGTLPLAAEETGQYLCEIPASWEVAEDSKTIRKEFKFKDFVRAMAFVDRVADIAEAEGHHPDIHIHYNRVVVELMTHAIGGLSENDFIVAAKIERLVKLTQGGADI